MQRFIYFFKIFALSLATDVIIYNELYYGSTGPVFKSAVPWKFGYTSSDRLHMAIFYKNQSPSVTKVAVSYESGLVTVRRQTVSNGKKANVFVRQFSGPEAIIYMNLYTSNGLCRSIRVAEGRIVSKKSEKEDKYADICFKEITKPCVFMVDLKQFICKGPSIDKPNYDNLTTATPFTDLDNNNTTGVSNVSSSTHKIMKTSTNSSSNNTETNDQKPPPQNNMIIYVITSLIGMCVIIFVIYLCIKKYGIQNSHPVETIELNTNATANEVVYADLSLMHGDSQPPRGDEETPYAEIIGELHAH